MRNKIEDLNKNWSLFLDRDGVINELLEGNYVTDWKDWTYTPNALLALEKLTNFFKHTVIVTNQQGIGKGLMTEEQLATLHNNLINDVIEKGGKIDKVYHAPQLAKHHHTWRKPRTGMAKQAQLDFPEIDFKHCVMVGDFITDMKFADKLGMIKVFISKTLTKPKEIEIDYCFENLNAFSSFLIEEKIIEN